MIPSKPCYAKQSCIKHESHEKTLLRVLSEVKILPRVGHANWSVVTRL